ncbi:MAG: hypothetical protein CL675_01630 [Bdellovibrionaceae bacterium]|mgnify:CR=1 FL=1|nr:hypothetical protein [Pseudobdellovibrionaceae bacterium]
MMVRLLLLSVSLLFIGSCASVPHEVSVSAYNTELIAEVIDGNSADLTFCYEEEMIRKPGFGGKVTLKWLLRNKDNVAKVDRIKVEKKGTTVRSRKFVRCLVRAVRKWDFPKIAGDNKVVITFPFLFEKDLDGDAEEAAQ